MTLFRKEALEQQNDRLHGEVVFTQPLSTKLFAGSLFGIIAIAAVWVSVGTYARIETVPGMLVTSVPSAKVVALQPGVVSELAVQEGQLIRKGDRLLVINSDRGSTGGGDVAGRGLGALAARQQLTEAQVAMAGGRATAERGRLATIITSAEQQAMSLRDQIALQEQVVVSNQQMFDQVLAVVERGFVSKVEMERRRQTLLSSQQSLANLRQQLTARTSDAQQARAQLASVAIEAEQGVSQIRDSLQALNAEQARLEGEQSYVISAPIDGRVTALAAGVGRSVNASRPVMVIVPDGAELMAELYAPTRAVGFVEAGKETRLLYDAFPYQRFGSFGGKVANISRTALDPRETDIPFPFEEPVYRIKVSLDQQRIDAFGGPSPLQAGMTLQANIVLERQTFLAWLLQPLNALLNRTA
ncbi:HlyD family efflux transporter periplasmic adaptor subunit [Erythrobacter sp.]|uniref:HlyD family secretion protein n=1 Tax=Erythrobacter sp. TaxID=1042 RepID=UPI0025D62FB8|nr:HlyD family efflux transporter periplasmic adaptor subunit [Erythrobacter sp.]